MCCNFEHPVHIRLHATYAVLIDVEPGEVQFCGAKLTLFIFERRIALPEYLEKRMDLAVVVSVAVADDYDVIAKICESIEPMSNLSV